MINLPIIDCTSVPLSLSNRLTVTYPPSLPVATTPPPNLISSSTPAYLARLSFSYDFATVLDTLEYPSVARYVRSQAFLGRHILSDWEEYRHDCHAVQPTTEFFRWLGVSHRQARGFFHEGFSRELDALASAEYASLQAQRFSSDGKLEKPSFMLINKVIHAMNEGKPYLRPLAAHQAHYIALCVFEFYRVDPSVRTPPHSAHADTRRVRKSR